MDKNLDEMDDHGLQAIQVFKTKISSEICKRRTILDALDYITRTDYMSCITRTADDLRSHVFSTNPNLLIYDVLRQAPVHLLETRNLPITSLEDIIDLVDSADADSLLPRAVLAYHMEAYNADFKDFGSKQGLDQVNASFMPANLLASVKSIY